MTDRSDDFSERDVRDALSRVAAATAPAADLADRLIAAARAGDGVVALPERHRARWAYPLLAAAAVAAVAIGGVSVASGLADDHDALPGDTGTAVLSTPPSSPGPSTSAPSTASSSAASTSTSPTPSTSRPASQHPTTRPPQSPASRAPLTAARLDNATIDLPAWPSVDGGAACLSGPRTFHDGSAPLPNSQWPGQGSLNLEGTPAVVDVDGDGADDAVAVVECGVHQPIGYRVLAFRSSTDGGVEVIGDVVGPLAYGSTTLGYPLSAAAGPGGIVRVRWSDQPAADPGSIVQTRGYRWTGGGFEQVEGPAALPDRSADVSVTAAPGTLDPSGDGTITAVVRNAGPIAATPDLVLLIDTHGVRLTSARGPDATLAIDQFAPGTQRVFVPAQPAGSRYVIRFRVHASAGASAPRLVFAVSGNPVDHAPGNNRATGTFVRR